MTNGLIPDQYRQRYNLKADYPMTAPSYSVGALGVIELTAPHRSAHVAAGLKRIGLNEKQRRYFDLHAVLDIHHSEAGNCEALIPLVAEDPRRAAPIAEGALIRLRCGTARFER